MIKSLFNKNTDDRIVIVGDVHGDLNQFIYPLIYFMNNFKQCRKIIYLGDYIDRGESNVYIYEILSKLISVNELKDKMIFLRGNHETYDSGVYDYMSLDVDKVNQTNSFIKSFMFEKFYALDLDIVHYDKDYNILFSHSPISRDLDSVIKLNTMKTNHKVMLENTYTNERENKNMTYRNIHGHDHTMSSNTDIDNFMNGTKNMISLDGDSSYGIRLIQNAYKKTARWTECITSNVKFMVMNNNTYELIERTIEFSSDRDLNTKSFEYIKKLLIEQSRNVSPIHYKFLNLNLNESINRFRQVYLDITNKDPQMKYILINIRNLYNTNINKKSSTNIYFHDVPLEIYQFFGFFNFIHSAPIYKLYWFNVLGVSHNIEEINRRYKIYPSIIDINNNFIKMERDYYNSINNPNSNISERVYGVGYNSMRNGMILNGLRGGNQNFSIGYDSNVGKNVKIIEIVVLSIVVIILLITLLSRYINNNSNININTRMKTHDVF